MPGPGPAHFLSWRLVVGSPPLAVAWHWKAVTAGVQRRRGGSHTSSHPAARMVAPPPMLSWNWVLGEIRGTVSASDLSCPGDQAQACLPQGQWPHVSYLLKQDTSTHPTFPVRAPGLAQERLHLTSHRPRWARGRLGGRRDSCVYIPLLMGSEWFFQHGMWATNEQERLRLGMGFLGLRGCSNSPISTLENIPE